MVLSCAGGGSIGGWTYIDTGCENTEGPLSASFYFSCSSSSIHVEVYPNCDSTPDTVWDFSLSCAR
jgi:hypothetical protein